ncbi:hypothetical protein AVEN_32069-1 [Araneus ventricosus]|uniref:Uncharacterized protein n=1 Tax=Araneus ventricosus TaxID=182803 RepID=A0A4Y2ECB9_ARAVE|nr:hypothetical protein AVEN_32069-1 [Araneus ventricosus]
MVYALMRHDGETISACWFYCLHWNSHRLNVKMKSRTGEATILGISKLDMFTTECTEAPGVSSIVFVCPGC